MILIVFHGTGFSKGLILGQCLSDSPPQQKQFPSNNLSMFLYHPVVNWLYNLGKLTMLSVSILSKYFGRFSELKIFLSKKNLRVYNDLNVRLW